LSSRFVHEGELRNAPGNENIRILKFDVLPTHGEMLSISSGMRFEIEFYNNVPDINLDVTFELQSADDVPVFHHGALVTTNKDSAQGIYTVAGELPVNLLNAGIYKFKVIFGQDQRYALFQIEDIVQFEVLNEAFGNNSSALPGIIRPQINYQIAYKASKAPSILI
jgi:lipopolysaccharide transport system ATP-binding protein